MTVSNFSSQVNVLLSTYNGEAYLLEQLQSLYQQTYPNVKVVVRDDGSSDSTLNLLKKEASDAKLVLQSPEANIGPAASFFKLLESSDDSDFFAFCDQDDLWNKDKIERAIEALTSIPSDIPAMYFSSVECVNEANNFIKLSPLPKKIGFGNALVENVATGCTVVLNKKARNLIVKSLPNQCLMHDSWCYLVVSCYGKILFDGSPSMRYRQHSNNTIGAATSVVDNFVRRIKRFSLRKHGRFRFSDQAAEFLEHYGDSIPSQHQALLSQFVKAKYSLLNRFCLAFSPTIWRQSFLDNLILRLLILLNRF